MNKVLCFFSVLALFANCTKPSDFELETVSLPAEILDNAVPIQADTFKITAEFPVAECYYVYNDSILIVQNYGRPDNYFLELYNYKENRIVKKVLTQGKGPKEVLTLSPTPQFFGSKMVSGDIAMQQLLIIDIDSLLSNNDYEIPKYPIMFAGGLSFGLFQGDLIAENPNCFKSEALGIELNPNRFITCNHEKNAYSLDLPDCAYNAINVTNGGNILSNDDKGVLCYAHKSESLIEFYDKERRMTKKITGPSSRPNDYHIDENKFIIFKGHIPYSYFSACSNSDYIYLFYANVYWDEIEKGANKGVYYIFKMDWNGQIIKTYKTNYLLHSLRCINSEQTKQDMLFGRIITDEGNPSIIKMIVD